jgi:hypothetical protein
MAARMFDERTDPRGQRGKGCTRTGIARHRAESLATKRNRPQFACASAMAAASARLMLGAPARSALTSHAAGLPRRRAGNRRRPRRLRHGRAETGPDSTPLNCVTGRCTYASAGLRDAVSDRKSRYQQSSNERRAQRNEPRLHPLERPTAIIRRRRSLSRGFAADATTDDCAASAAEITSASTDRAITRRSHRRR